MLGVGALLAISWFIYTQQSKGNFWMWPGISGVVVSSVGIAMLIFGFLMPEDEASVQQRQRGGRQSVNLQAGRDIKLRDDRSGD